jgi:hypothetical protein
VLVSLQNEEFDLIKGIIVASAVVQGKQHFVLVSKSRSSVGEFEMNVAPTRNFRACKPINL